MPGSDPIDPSDIPACLGRKVAMRFRLEGDPKHPFSEVVGVVQSVAKDDDGVMNVKIVTRRADVVSVRLTDVLNVKLFAS